MNIALYDLIKALKIFQRYGGSEDFHCEHDELVYHGLDPELVSKKDIKELDKCGFFIEDSAFKSFRYGSC